MMPSQSLRTTLAPQVPHRRYSEPVRRSTRGFERPGSRRPSGLYDGEPETSRRSLVPFLCVMAHLALLVLVFRVFRLEGRAFQSVATLALAILPIHYALPMRWKQPMLAAVSMGALGMVFGWPIAGFVVGFGCFLIVLSRSSIPWGWRAALVGGAALLMGMARGGVLSIPIPEMVWPLLASLFMFRMIIYLYELKHATTRDSFSDALGYFFLLPNICFLHFPVVDYRSFRRGYFANEIHATQRRGLSMMVRGTVHLLLYRLIYHKLLITPSDVRDLPTLALFLFCNYLLYLRVSGQFHMACGLMHLFGYQLPDTHHNYLLATGFTDYWRRINIYWKDFMVRVVFNPLVFRLKGWPLHRALMAGTALVFGVTWALHGYQSFWLRGSWGFSVQDGLFWGILGVLVMFNVRSDALRPRGRSAAASAGFVPIAVRVLKTAGTLVTISLLWSLWSSQSVHDWLEMLRRAVP